MITIDGSAGEGGGQILRTALTLSLITGKPFKIQNIRAGRAKPGLLRQHLTCIQAAQTVGKAHVSGATLGSTQIEFSPNGIHSGNYEFSIGTAGSAILVAQTVALPLLFASSVSTLTVQGGTHNPFSPTFDFFEKCYVPSLNRMGASITTQLESYGFYPAGGGKIKVEITPLQAVGQTALCPLDWTEIGSRDSAQISAWVLSASLPQGIALREIEVLREKLNLDSHLLSVRTTSQNLSPGNVVFVEVSQSLVTPSNQDQQVTRTEIFSAVGTQGVRAESVAKKAAQAALAYLESRACVGEYLADQLLIPMALAKSGTFTCSTFSSHAQSNLTVIEAFFENLSFEVKSVHAFQQVNLTSKL